ncbi:MAG TPA: tetratricopeptide repeat protein [Steroidobacteraceae bacterium]|nr:tetratricopeptide repeat protein [Steroidobacteraceae bacterium]
MGSVKTLAWLGAALLAGACAPALAVTDADRVAVYKEFRTQFDAKQYAAAQPLAERLVQLTEEQYGTDELQLTNPLSNLATVQFRLGNFPAAIETYQRSLRILQAKSTMADKAQIGPLHGLGIAFMNNNDYESAVVALKRAADLSRNTDGLFNINQVEFIDALIEAYANTGRWAEADKEAQYAMRVEEAAYGRSSVNLMDRLDKLARWFELSRRYTTERALYERALAILEKGAPPNDLRKVNPLRGIARSFRLESFYGVEGADTGATFNASGNGAPVFADGTQQRRGETALAAALDVIDANPPADQGLRGIVLTDLGDWYLTSNATRRAYDAYADAWKALTQVNDTKLLDSPRILAYRPSISSVDRSQLDPEESVVKVVELHFRVDRDGRVDDVTSPTTDVPDAIVKNSMMSMKRSRYAPRIENGAAVPTTDVVFRERVLVRVSPESAPPADSAAEKKPEDSQAPESKSDPTSNPAKTESSKPASPAPSPAPPGSAPPPAAR